MTGIATAAVTNALGDLVQRLRAIVVDEPLSPEERAEMAMGRLRAHAAQGCPCCGLNLRDLTAES